MEEVTRKAGQILSDFFRKDLEIRHKSRVDLVTEADERAEQAIVATIKARYPDDHILAEETGRHRGKNEYTWIIDPLDGTTNFAHGFGHFCVSIALRKGKQTIEGTIYDPIKEEWFHAKLGESASCNGKPIAVREREDLRQALCVSGFPYNRAERTGELLERAERVLVGTRGFRRLGSAALDLCYVASGRFDVYYEDSLNPWDIAAGLLIASEAGATCCDFSGGPVHLDKGELLICHPKLRDQALAIVR